MTNESTQTLTNVLKRVNEMLGQKKYMNAVWTKTRKRKISEKKINGLQKSHTTSKRV